jgi:hypothetical protein
MTVEATTYQSSKLEKQPATMYFNPANICEKVFPTKQNSNMHVSLAENEACNIKVYDLRKK